MKPEKRTVVQGGDCRALVAAGDLGNGRLSENSSAVVTGRCWPIPPGDWPRPNGRDRGVAAVPGYTAGLDG
jgi:hypothetical protein